MTFTKVPRSLICLCPTRNKLDLLKKFSFLNRDQTIGDSQTLSAYWQILHGAVNLPAVGLALASIEIYSHCTDVTLVLALE
jgi:hypothetical protein